jgi:hypothetical protein
VTNSKTWQVFLDGRIIDAVFFTDNCDKEYVKSSLILHDGYNPAIVVKEEELETVD